MAAVRDEKLTLPAMQRNVPTAIMVMGFSGLVAEILLLRELLIVFSGNDLSIGIILANWLILEALGCYSVGRWVERPGEKLTAFTLITVFFSLSIFLALFLTRSLKILLGVSIGESIGFLPMLLSSLVILLPVSLFHGALFTYGCQIHADCSGRTASVAGRVYVYETLGTIIGGIACTYVLIPHVDAFQVAAGLALLNILVCMGLLISLPQGGRKALIAQVVLVVLALVIGWSLLTGGVAHLHRYAIDIQWQGLKVETCRNSPYGNICVVENEGQYIYFLDGIAAIIAPIPDIAQVEKFVNLPLLAHPAPRKMLIISGGVGGVINEALKHPTLVRVDYAEQDPLLLDLVRQFPTPLTSSELADPRVRIHSTDGRLLLQTSREQYDLIFIGVNEPASLQANRYFTREFFDLARKRLYPDGILVLGLPGSRTYLNEELRNLNSSIYHTLSDVFAYLRVFPGDGRNLFLASAASHITDLDRARLSLRLIERQTLADGFVPRHIEQNLHPGWQEWFLDFIDGGSRQLNRDHKPLGMFYTLAHWNAVYSPSFAPLFSQFEKTTLPTAALLLLLLSALYLPFRRKYRRLARLSIPLALVSTGFSGMIFSLVVIFSFEVTYGHIFSWIGLLVAAFMAGAVLGANLVTRWMDRIAQPLQLLRSIDLALVAFAIGLPLVLVAVHAGAETESAFTLFRMLFLLVSLLSGVLVGGQFPLANRIVLDGGCGMSETAARLYTADLLGGWVGGIIGGVMLLPILGLTGTCLLVGMLKAISYYLISKEPVGLSVEVQR